MTAPAREKRAELLDVRELRPAARPFAVRADGNSGTVTLTGYAATFEPYEMYGGPAAYGWIEQIHPEAFSRTLKEKPDLHLLINHAGMPLARTKSGTLTLSADQVGLRVEAKLDLDDPDVQRLRTKMKRGDMDEMSFAFRVKAQIWSTALGFDDPQSHRLITEVSLHKGDVSVVNFGANPSTAAELASRRRKSADGKRITLTVAEAEAMLLADRKWMARRQVAVGRSIVALSRQAAADDAAWAAQQAASDAIVTRAHEILAECGYRHQARWTRRRDRRGGSGTAAYSAAIRKTQSRCPRCSTGSKRQSSNGPARAGRLS